MALALPDKTVQQALRSMSQRLSGQCSEARKT
jgi:hypothetical protein